MSNIPFKSVRLEKDDVITRSDLDQMADNLQYIQENTPRGRFVKGSGRIQNVQTILVGGRVWIKKNKKADTATAKVTFPANLFHPACHPHVTTGVVGAMGPKIFCVVNGPRGKNYPNSTGFEVMINIAADKKKNDVIRKGLWVDWHAFGYTEAPE